jgi:hypothetical protein
MAAAAAISGFVFAIVAVLAPRWTPAWAHC